ncbi:unnamed protein product [Lampetra planeri]
MSDPRWAPGPADSSWRETPAGTGNSPPPLSPRCEPVPFSLFWGAVPPAFPLRGDAACTAPASSDGDDDDDELAVRCWSSRREKIST